MKELIFILLLSIISVNSFNQVSDYEKFYLEDDKFSKVDFSRVIHFVETEKHFYFFYDTTDWKIREILPQITLSGIPFLFISKFQNPDKFLAIELPIIIGSIIYTKIYIRKNRYIRIKK